MKDPAPLVEIRNVDVELGGQRILRNVSWRFEPGQHWVMLGRNGSGKSTLLRLIRGELWPAAGQAERRAYHLNGDSQFTAIGVKEQMAIVSPEQQARYLYQEWNLDVTQVVQSGVGAGDYVYRRLTPSQRRFVEKLMKAWKIWHLRLRAAQELSTGELRRVLIARALAGRPRVLLCDEIGDGLDAASRALLLTMLDETARQGTQLLIATHRADEIPAAITHCMVIAKGSVVEQGKLEGRRLPMHRQFELGFKDAGQPLTTPPPAAKPDLLVQISGADVYLGQAPTLRQINLEIRRGQHWAVLGPNGSGKSTLLRLLAGDVHPARGAHVRRFNFTSRNTLWEVRERLGYVSPDLQANYREPMRGEDVVASGFFSSVGLVRKPSAAQRRQVREVIQKLGLHSLRSKNLLEMSYGEARRILLARALVKRPELILFDEPFDGLDPMARQDMAAAINRAAETGATLVIVTHHADDLPGCITNVAKMNKGRLVAIGLARRAGKNIEKTNPS
jgi:molybdate transport system ATP-binding protein